MAANWVLASSLCIYVVAVLIRGDDSQAGTSALLCDAENHIFIIKRNPDPVKCLPQTKGQLPGVQTIKYPPFKIYIPFKLKKTGNPVTMLLQFCYNSQEF